MTHFPRLSLARRAAGALLLCLAAPLAGATASWPQVEVPPNASVYSVDSVTTVDGLPLKMQGFTSIMTVAELSAWYRQKLGRDVVENRHGNKLILGQGSGDYFISVQLEPAGNQTRAIVAVSNLTAGMKQRPATEAANARLLGRLPAGTRVVSRLAAIDGPRNATHIVLANGHGEQVNRDSVVRMLQADGLKLEHVAPAAAASATGATLYFKGKGAEAIAVLTRGPDGQMTIVLNTTTFMEIYK